MAHRSIELLETGTTGIAIGFLQQRAMDFTYLAGVLPTSTQELVWWSCFSLLTLVVFKILLHSNAEDAIEFSVPVPEACRAGWEGKQLDETSIKVCSDESLDVI
jgi:hypothetical protein